MQTQTKLTLRLNSALIEQAKAYGKTRGKSLSQLVSDFFVALEREDGPALLPPLVASLKGAARGVELDEDDYRQHLAKKHLG
ncbi:MAG: DUF6364 family protein [Pseudomonadota bacterium]|nr:DUF6364 family protein [Pseudomonadota bacterium]